MLHALATLCMIIVANLTFVFAVPKHVQLIQFSLLSAPEGEWMVRPESAMKHRTPKQKQEALRREKATKKKEQERLRKGILLPKTIERLKQVMVQATLF